jgi:death-on-curing protein
VIRYLSLAEVLTLHGLIIDQTGGSDGLRDLGMLESALGQPRQTFGGVDLYPSMTLKQRSWRRLLERGPVRSSRLGLSLT